MRNLLVTSFLALASCAEVHDWPMFGRDASRNAVSPEKNPPTGWSTEKEKERNVAWKAKLGSECFSAPVVADGRIWVGTNNDSPRDSVRNEDAAVLMCFRERDGEFLWEYLWPRRKGRYWGFDRDHSPLRCSPLVEGDRLWLMNNNWEVVCFDLQPLRDGTGEPRELWKTDLQECGAHPILPAMAIGMACSISFPLAGRLYVSTGNGPDEGKPFDGPAVVCLDSTTGKMLGREASGIGLRSLESNWSSPVTAALAGGQDDSRTLVVYGGGDGFLYAFDPVPAQGILKEVWRVDCRRRADTGGGIFSTPVIQAGRVYVGIGMMDNSQPGKLSCVDLATGRIVWDSLEMETTLSTPVVAGGKVFAVDSSGYVRGFEATTGRLIWQYDSLSTIVASPLLVDGKLYVSTLDGETLVIDTRPTTGVARRLSVMEDSHGCCASPIYANGTLYLCNGRWLYAIQGHEPVEVLRGMTDRPRGRARDALFVPTPTDVVQKMLELAQIQESDLVYDLGSGDGRIVISAGRTCRAVGIEIDQELVDQSRLAIKTQGLEKQVRIEHEDLLKADFSGATVVTLYVGARLNSLLVPKLKALRPGSRIVSHDFEVPDMSCDRDVTVVSSEDGRGHRIFRYRIGGSK